MEKVVTGVPLMNHENIWLKNIANAGNRPGGPQMPRFPAPLGSVQRLYVSGGSPSAGEHAVPPHADSAPPRYMPVPVQLKPSTSPFKLSSAPAGVAGAFPVQAGPSRFVPADPAPRPAMHFAPVQLYRPPTLQARHPAAASPARTGNNVRAGLYQHAPRVQTSAPIAPPPALPLGAGGSTLLRKPTLPSRSDVPARHGSAVQRAVIQRVPQTEMVADWKGLKKKVDRKHRKLIGDAERIRNILTDEGLVRRAMEKLEGEVIEHTTMFGVRNLSRGKHVTSKALTSVLSKREMEYGLGTNVPIYTGVLDADAFQAVARQGRLFKDVGVLQTHGEYTHRIQWYIVLFGMSDGFTRPKDKLKKFNYEPRELLNRINNSGVDPGPVYPNASKPNNLWDALFDYGSSAQHVRSSGLTGPENFLASLIGAVGDGTDRSAYAPTVNDILARRRTKRLGESDPGGVYNRTYKADYAARKLASGKYYADPDIDKVLFSVKDQS